MDEKKKQDRKRLLALGLKKREELRAEAARYRRAIKSRGIASAIVRLPKATLETAKDMAAVRNMSLNSLLSDIAEEAVDRWEKDVMALKNMSLNALFSHLYGETTDPWAKEHWEDVLLSYRLKNTDRDQPLRESVIPGLHEFGMNMLATGHPVRKKPTKTQDDPSWEAFRSRQKKRDWSLAVTIIRMNKNTKEALKGLAALKRGSLNAILSDIIGEAAHCWEEGLFKYYMGIRDWNKAIEDLGIRNVKAFIHALKTREYFLKEEDEKALTERFSE